MTTSPAPQTEPPAAMAPPPPAQPRPEQPGTPRRQGHLWPMVTVYERFEQAVSLLLTVLLSALIVVTLIHLTLDVGDLLLSNPSSAVVPEIFQAAFGTVMTVLIALEFNHTILSVFDRKHGIVQVRTVVLIALLALVRKFILLDVEKETPLMVIGLAASVLALGAVYWLAHEQERRAAAASPEQRKA